VGLGDWIMCTGQVKRLHLEKAVPVLVVDRFGRPQWNQIFDNNPRLTRSPNGRYQKLIDGPGARPYIADDHPRRYQWQKFNLLPGELFFSADELVKAEPWRGYVLIEPHVKGTTSVGNKAWPWDRWQQLVHSLPFLPWLQVGKPLGTRWLQGVQRLETPTFRDAAAVLSLSRAFVGSEGGMHHAAAAVQVPAVVLFGGYISPAITGYPTHRNLFTGGKACGSRIACAHCTQAMLAITVDMVADNLEDILHENDTRVELARSRNALDQVDGRTEEQDATQRPVDLPGA
jgi:ADP-heptose:LPS heptosyltransferase